MSEIEFEEIRQVSRASGQTISEWVRTVLREARRSRARGDTSGKLAAIRKAATHEFPIGDIEQVLEEIESGYK
jgi:hypothetical protein